MIIRAPTGITALARSPSKEARKWHPSFFCCWLSVAFLALGMARAPMWAWAVAVGVLTLLATVGSAGWCEPGARHLVVDRVAAVRGPRRCFRSRSLRRSLIIAPVFAQVRRILPKVSDTEAQALEAGTVGFDAEIFSGTPDWNKLQSIPPIQLSAEEQAFLDGPTHQLCAMINDWQVRHSLREIPEDIWDFVKKNGFLGMLISKEHGGLGFSPQAQSLILGKIASRSPDVVTIVMVPNSLGPGELIEKYGTDAAEASLLAATGEGRGSAVLFADRPDVGLGCRHDARHRLCDARHVSRATRRSASACRGTSATLRSARRRRSSAWRFASSTRTTCSARARTSASRWR